MHGRTKAIFPAIVGDGVITSKNLADGTFIFPPKLNFDG